MPNREHRAFDLDRKTVINWIDRTPKARMPSPKRRSPLLRGPERAAVSPSGGPPRQLEGFRHDPIDRPWKPWTLLAWASPPGSSRRTRSPPPCGPPPARSFRPGGDAGMVARLTSGTKFGGRIRARPARRHAPVICRFACRPGEAPPPAEPGPSARTSRAGQEVGRQIGGDDDPRGSWTIDPHGPRLPPEQGLSTAGWLCFQSSYLRHQGIPGFALEWNPEGIRRDTTSPSRGKPAERDGEGARRPGLARMICSCEYRFDEVQALRAAVIRSASDRGFLTRSDGGPPTGRNVGYVLDRMWAISAWACRRPPIPRRLEFCPVLQRPCPGPSRRPPFKGKPTNASRSTTPESRIGRRPCALPVLSGGIRIRAVRKGEDKTGRESSGR